MFTWSLCQKGNRKKSSQTMLSQTLYNSISLMHTGRLLSILWLQGQRVNQSLFDVKRGDKHSHLKKEWFCSWQIYVCFISFHVTLRYHCGRFCPYGSFFTFHFAITLVVLVWFFVTRLFSRSILEFQFTFFKSVFNSLCNNSTTLIDHSRQKCPLQKTLIKTLY